MSPAFLFSSTCNGYYLVTGEGLNRDYLMIWETGERKSETKSETGASRFAASRP